MARDPFDFSGIPPKRTSDGVQKPRSVEETIRAAAEKYGINPDDMVTVGKIESGLKPDAKNPKSSAGGLFQFIDDTWKQYGSGDKFDPEANADAAGRYLRDVSKTLTKRLGREPTGWELYLGHQQGAGGASRILGAPDDLARDTVGAKRVALNGGHTGMTNREFAGMWESKFTKKSGRPAAPADPFDFAGIAPRASPAPAEADPFDFSGIAPVNTA